MNRSRLTSYASVSFFWSRSSLSSKQNRPASDREESNCEARNNRLVVHEWGTFTSIAERTGSRSSGNRSTDQATCPVCLRHERARQRTGLRHLERCVKCNYEALVRMETPVIYSIAERETTVSVRVDFSKGKITEWYPQARGFTFPVHTTRGILRLLIGDE